MESDAHAPITITELKLADARARLTLSGGSSQLIISAETVSQWHLAKGVVVTAEQVTLLREESARWDARQRAIELLSRRDYAMAHLESTLIRRGVSSTHAVEVVRNLVQSGIVDDTSTARRLVERLVNQKPCGERYLVALLRRRGYSSSLAQDTAREFLAKQSESESALRALQPRMRRIRQFELEQARHKAYTYLSRRGFSYQAAVTAFTQLWNERPADD